MAERGLDVLQGTLEMLILTTLAGGAERHGFEILDRIRAGTDEVLVIEEGALYPALHRMEKRGWLAATWGVSDKGRRAKYYRVTREGSLAFERQRVDWRGYVDAVARLARAEEA